MTSYTISARSIPTGVVLTGAFGDPAANTTLVVDAQAAIKALNLDGGRTVFITGPASLPVAYVVSHVVAHLFTEVEVYDPKLSGFVVAVSHGGRPIGTLLPSSDAE